MSEGSLAAPVRQVIPWENESFVDPVLIDDEMRRVFDICHGCRRCFNLCDSFPRLFDMIDDSETGELDSVESYKFKHVVDACTLCDMCFMTKCPYVPPHEFNLDFPHLMLRFRAMEFKEGKVSFFHRELTKTDRNGRLATLISPIVNWTLAPSNKFSRWLLFLLFGIDKSVALPVFNKKTFQQSMEIDRNQIASNKTRKAVIYATCFVNFNNSKIGEAAQKVLAHNGVKTHIVYPKCCGMPQLEQGNLEQVANNAKIISSELGRWVDEGYDIVSLVPSCSLMLKSEWPLILPKDENVVKVSRATFDISEYIVDLNKKEGLKAGFGNLDGKVLLHLSCHSRAQNMGPKAADMLKLIPNIDLSVIDRCSGHGGTWGLMKKNFETAIKVGKPVSKKVSELGFKTLVSECPLARKHIKQCAKDVEGQVFDEALESISHPIEILAISYKVNEKK